MMQAAPCAIRQSAQLASDHKNYSQSCRMQITSFMWHATLRVGGGVGWLRCTGLGDRWPVQVFPTSRSRKLDLFLWCVTPRVPGSPQMRWGVTKRHINRKFGRITQNWFLNVNHKHWFCSIIYILQRLRFHWSVLLYMCLQLDKYWLTGTGSCDIFRLDFLLNCINFQGFIES